MKLDTSASPETRNTGDPTVDAAAPHRVPIYWPSPPYGSYPGPSEHFEPMACMIQGSNGRVSRAVLICIHFEERYAEVRYASAKAPIALRFGQFYSLTLAEPVSPIARRAEAGGTHAMFEERPRMPYRILFKDSKSIVGKTIGCIEKNGGLFLFSPIDDTDRVIRTFIPKEAVLHQEVGTPIGRLLVEQRALSAEQVEQTASLQDELRSQKVGEILLRQNIVSPVDLRNALELQRARPVMRVGEALVSLGVLRQEQLDSVLAVQRNDRTAPLGELLVRQKLLTREELRAVLARKMGYPVVDVANFPSEAAALRRVPYGIARRLHVLPLVLNEASLVVAIDDVTRQATLDELEFIAQIKVVPALAGTGAMDDAIKSAYADLGAEETPAPATGPARHDSEPPATGVGRFAPNPDEAPGGDAREESGIHQSDSSLVRLINQMFLKAHGEGVSDIHVECYSGSERIRIRFRKDGRLQPYLELPHAYHDALVTRLKVMSDLDPDERRRPQHGKIAFARQSALNKLELRVATIPTEGGFEDVVIRLQGSAGPIPLDGIGLSRDNLASFKQMIERTAGLVLCAGPTGSGSTTNVHAALAHINQPERKIWTAEDPIEITQPGLRQVQIDPKIGWNFVEAMRAFQHADPDVILVGELRDPDAARAALEASLTGRLVLSTLHTDTAAQAVTRLLGMGVDSFGLADALAGVLAQRLLRALCPNCRTERPASDEEIENLLTDYLSAAPAESAGAGARDALRADWHARFERQGRLKLATAGGCKFCDGHGHKGRLSVQELLVNGPELRRRIHARSKPEELLAAAVAGGMRTLRQDGIEKALQGLTTVEEIRSIGAAV
jgi:type II secretory ATPase GspE/PulE/Tfp pilus assembly ATPase PilB-like protein